MSAKVLHGDCRELLGAMPDNSVSSLVTDPPYGLGKTPPIVEILTRWLAGEDVRGSGGGFMNRTWDSFVPGPSTWREVFRVMKPGAHGVVFAGDRTVDLMAIALRLAGFEIRHQGVWVSAQVFPKSLDISKAIDALYGAAREVVGENPRAAQQTPKRGTATLGDFGGTPLGLTAPATPDAAKWSGYGTALKTIEPWILIRKPLSESSIARNVLRWGTGALNIDGCRLPFAGDNTDTDDIHAKNPHTVGGIGTSDIYNSGRPTLYEVGAGRWPSALIAADLDVEGPVGGVRVADNDGLGRSSGQMQPTATGESGYDGGWNGERKVPPDPERGAGDVGGVLGPYTRHFRIPGTDGTQDEAFPPEIESLIICPKASTAEREEGLDGFEVHGWTDGREKTIDNPRLRMGKRRRNVHPTVKPVALMRHLIRLVTPPDGTCLDPFTGSGSTGVAAVWEGRDFIGCEMTDTEREPFVRIARARIAYAQRTKPPELRCRQPQPDVDPRQRDLFTALSEAAE